MRKLDRWRHLAKDERRLLLEAVGELARARVVLWFRPFSSVWLGLEGRRRAADRGLGLDAVDPSAVARAVRRASRLVPMANCLPQALATYTLLARRGIESEVRLGVARDGQRFKAHAWVELDGIVLIGKVDDLHRYEPLPQLPRRYP